MLHTSEKTHPVIASINKWNNDIVNDYNKYVRDINVFTDGKNNPHTRHTFEGRGGNLHIFGKGRCAENIEHFPSIFNLINEVDSDPDTHTTAVFAAIFYGKGRICLHTDVDNEFIVVKKPGKLFQRKVRQYRAHIPIIIPDDCYFYHIDKNVNRIHWEVNKSFLFEKYDKHYSVNNSDLTRVILEYDFFQAVN